MPRGAVLLCFLLCSSASAPALAQVAWEAGFKGGVGFGKLKGDTEFGGTAFIDGATISVSGELDAYRTGFCGGGFVTASLTPSFGIRLETLFSQKGGQGDFAFTISTGAGTFPGTGVQTYKLDYLEFPLLAVGSFAAGARTRIDLFGGPVFSFNTGAHAQTKLEIDMNGVPLEDNAQTDIGDNVTGTDVGFALGAGLTILSSPRVSIDARFMHGVTNLLDTPGSVDLKNTSIVFMAGLAFPLGSGSP